MEFTTGSSSNIKLASRWMNHCHNSHEACKAGRRDIGPGQPLPRRFVNVENTDRPFLQERGDIDDALYVALSYCWGEGHRLRTLESNIDAHRRTIPPDTLPRTFKDAMYMAHKLQYKFIWIDALCIIQDCLEDLSRELPRMGDIYQHASLTIYAEGAQTVHSGLFQQIDPRLHYPCEVELRGAMPDGTIFADTVTLSAACKGPNYLESRGWVLQEEILSSRRLLFGKQMSWLCTDGHASETRPVPVDRRAPALGTATVGASAMRSWLLSPERMSKVPLLDFVRGDGFDAWYTMLETYTARHLTFVSDTLPALSGLAALFARAHDAKYAAGLWAEDLRLGLAWYVAGDNTRPPPVERNEGCPRETADQKDNAPSWSWASMKGTRISFRSVRGGPLQGMGMEWNAGLHVLSVECQVREAANPFGKTDSGALRARGWRKQVILKRHSSVFAGTKKLTLEPRGSPFQVGPARENQRFAAKLIDPESGEQIGEGALDLPREARQQQVSAMKKPVDQRAEAGIWCMLLLYREKNLWKDVTCLLLQESDKREGCYRRIGLAFLPCLDWFGIAKTGDIMDGDAHASVMDGEVEIV